MTPFGFRPPPTQRLTGGKGGSPNAPGSPSNPLAAALMNMRGQAEQQRESAGGFGAPVNLPPLDFDSVRGRGTVPEKISRPENPFGGAKGGRGGSKGGRIGQPPARRGVLDKSAMTMGNFGDR